MSLKPILIHTHFHHRRTGVTRSIENVMPHFEKNFETYIYGYGILGATISTSEVKQLLFANREVYVHCHRNNEILKMLWFRFLGAKFTLIASRHAASKPSKMTMFLLKKADKVVSLINSMSQDLGIKSTVVGHGIDVDYFVPNPTASIPNITQKNIVITAGRVRKAKGQHILVKAMLPILKEHQDWALAIVGKVDKASFLEELKQLVKASNVENQVYFVNETSDIRSYYQASKIAVTPSFSEGFSLVTAEAMACACTVIATAGVGVHSDLIRHTDNGYLVEAGAISELQELLKNTITGKLPFLGTSARKTIIANWCAQHEAENLMNLYKPMLKEV